MNAKSEPPEEPLIAKDATYHRAPDELNARVRASLRATLASESRERRAPFVWQSFGWLLACAAVAVVTWNLAAIRMSTRPELVALATDQRLASEVVAAHVRSLMAPNHLNDVASSDQHTVKPWFTGKLDFAPQVADFSAAGYTLTGGRLDYIDGRAAAALTYRYRQHVVNFFAWPAEGAAPVAPHVQSRQGFSLVGWTQGGMRYCVVADASPESLLVLTGLLRNGAS